MDGTVDAFLLALISDEFLRAYYAIFVTAVVIGSISLATNIYARLENLEPQDFSAANTGNRTKDCQKVHEQLQSAREYKIDKGREARINAYIVAMLGVLVPTVVLVITVVLLPWLLGISGLVVIAGAGIGSSVLAPTPQDIFGLFVQALITEDGVGFLRALLQTSDIVTVGFDTKNLLVFLLLVAQKIWAIAFLKDLTVEIAPRIWRFSTAQSEREGSLLTKLNELGCRTGEVGNVVS